MLTYLTTKMTMKKDIDRLLLLIAPWAKPVEGTQERGKQLEVGNPGCHGQCQ